MEQKLNIAEILKNKPQGIKLYSPIFGDCTLCYVKDESSDICVRRPYNEVNYFNFDGVYHTGGECLLFPSNEMRDWSKFAWQKGDILVNENNAHIIFEKFTDDTYTTFIGRHYLNKNYKNYVPGRYTRVTQHFHIEESNAAQIYIYNIEEKIGGKLDLKTLEIEKSKCKLKPFDKVVVRCSKADKWSIDFFSYKVSNGYICTGDAWFGYCLPYNEETAHLLGTTDDWEGNENERT